MNIGRYELHDLIGAGGMGEVYRARDLELNREVALKTLPALFVADAERVARFEREARILATLNHPNIATVYGFERDGPVLALVMELIAGETLAERLRGSAPPSRGLALATALSIARQLVGALDAAHEKGIIHRDLKPANIKLTSDDEVKVLDFGLAKSVEAESGSQTTLATPPMTRLGVVLGTAAYMSPEQARGQVLDKRTDIWAFGCILYEMLAGRPAIAGETISDTIAAVLGADIDVGALPADVPVAVRALVARCLERNTKARLRDIADARLYLDMPAAPAQTAAPGSVSRRTALLSGAAALGLIGVGAAGAGALVPRAPFPATPTYQRLTFRRGMIRTARFGPDFKTVFYGALWDGDVCRVYTVRPESPESDARPLPPSTVLAVSASGEMALALGAHSRGIMPYGTLARVPFAGGAPREMQEHVKYADWSPDGRDLAIVRRDGARDLLEFPAGTVIAEPDAAGGGFSFPRVSPRGDAVAMFELDAADGLGGRVVVLDRSGKKRVVSGRYFNVFGLAWKQDEVWFSAADDLPLFRNTIHAMNASAAVRIVARVPGNTSLHDIAPDGRVLMARTEDRGGMAVHVPGEAAVRDLSWLDAPILASISPDGRRILFTETGVGGGPKGSTYLRGTDGSPAVRLGDGFAHALSPDGRWAMVQTDPAYIDVLPTGAGQARRLERAGLKIGVAQWLPDGEHAVLRAKPASGPARLYVLEVNGPMTRPITPDGLDVSSSGWAISPDGSMVAVSSRQRLELYPITGGAARQVPDASNRWTVVAWIASGLLVTEDPAAAGTVFRVDPTTGRRDTWADIQPQDPAGIMNLNLSTMVVTPDGRGYGYTWHRAMSDLYLVEGWS